MGNPGYNDIDMQHCTAKERRARKAIPFSSGCANLCDFEEDGEMRSQTILVVVLLAVANVASATIVQGIDIDFVTIGNAGNAGDTRTQSFPNDKSFATPYGCGAVGYDYQIGKYEITNGQWDAFVTAAGAPTGYPGTAYDDNARYTATNVPTNEVSWVEAAQFCNYLTSGDKSLGAYLFSENDGEIYAFLGIDRDSAVSTYGMVYAIPTEDEWYKAAYYTGSGYSTYANGTDAAPIIDGGDTNYGNPSSRPWDIGTGTEEQNGTFDMMGNVWEWNETLNGSYRGLRGGAFDYGSAQLVSSYRHSYPGEDDNGIGFRVASVPEPAALFLISLLPSGCAYIT